MENRKIGRDITVILALSSFTVIVIMCIMFFSSLSLQFDKDGISRGSANDLELDSFIQNKEYRAALVRVDFVLADKNSNLSRFAYFDRFLPEQERYDASVTRAEIYALQWKRIEILQAKNDVVTLKAALEDYSDIIGYNQERAKALLKQIKEEQP